MVIVKRSPTGNHLKFSSPHSMDRQRYDGKERLLKRRMPAAQAIEEIHVRRTGEKIHESIG
jgi:hypothetical protein